MITKKQWQNVLKKLRFARQHVAYIEFHHEHGKIYPVTGVPDGTNLVMIKSPHPLGKALGAGEWGITEIFFESYRDALDSFRVTTSIPLDEIVKRI